MLIFLISVPIVFWTAVGILLLVGLPAEAAFLGAVPVTIGGFFLWLSRSVAEDEAKDRGKARAIQPGQVSSVISSDPSVRQCRSCRQRWRPEAASELDRCPACGHLVG